MSRPPAGRPPAGRPPAKKAAAKKPPDQAKCPHEKWSPATTRSSGLLMKECLACGKVRLA